MNTMFVNVIWSTDGAPQFNLKNYSKLKADFFDQEDLNLFESL